MAPKTKIIANGVEIGLFGNIVNEEAFICITDMAKYKNADDPRVVITNWMSSYATIDYLAVWEGLHNPEFNGTEYKAIRGEPGRLVMTPKQWIERTQAIGITSKTGRNGGTYAHSDIAFEFASWLSPEFRLYIIKDYQRIKKDEAERKAIGWDEKRALSKMNYHIHTDAIHQYLIDEELSQQDKSLMYASEADMLNLALFGKRASEWRKTHPEECNRGENIRDYASAEELIILINMESYNAELIKEGLDREMRFLRLREMSRQQMEVLLRYNSKEKLKQINPHLLKDGEADAN